MRIFSQTKVLDVDILILHRDTAGQERYKVRSDSWHLQKGTKVYLLSGLCRYTTVPGMRPALYGPIDLINCKGTHVLPQRKLRSCGL